MNRTGLLLGAGASYELGMPLVGELTAEIRNWLTPDKLRELNEGWRLQFKGGGYSDEILEDFNSALAIKALHYESVLGHLETQFRRARGSSGQQYHHLYSWLVELVYHLLYYRQVNNRPLLERHLQFYEGIRVLADDSNPLWIFSLNHDVMIEAIAARFLIPLHTGFSPTTITLPRRDSVGRKIGDIRAECLTQGDLEHGALHFPNPPQPGIYLLKIHGALDVFTFNDGRDLLKLLPTMEGEDGVLDVLRVANEELHYLLPGYPGGKVKATNEIAYADDQGEMQFLRRSLLAGAYKFDERRSQVLPRSVLKHFRANLNFVSALVCIGYSFSDLHVNLAIREWLEFSEQRRLEIVDPSISGTPDFLRHLWRQVTTSNVSATEYLDREGGLVRSNSERVEKRLSSTLRALGKEASLKLLQDFGIRQQERLAHAFAERLRAFPVVNGTPDFSAAGDPALLAKQWASELKLTRDEFMAALLSHIESNANDSQ